MNLLRSTSLLVPSQLTFLKSCILLHLDYCDVVWYSCTHKDSSRLQFLFNFACRLALHCPQLSSSTELWSDLGLTSLEVRRKIHAAQLTLKCHNSSAPSYLSSVFHCPTHDHNTRTRTLTNLPSVRSSFGQPAFSYV